MASRARSDPSRLLLLAGWVLLFALGASTTGFCRSYPISAGQSAVGRVETFITREEDTLLDVARAYDLGFTEMMAANRGIDPWVPHAGKSVIVPALFLLPNVPREGIVVNLVRQRLYYFPPGGTSVETYPVGVGAEGRTTPLGATRIARKQAHPTWYPPPSILAEDPELPKVVPPGPDNPMGDFALYLGWPTYTIHGTDKPYGVGRNSSHGCLRLYPEDIAALYQLASVGTKVTVINEDVEMAWLGNDLYLAIFPTKEQAEEIALGHDPAALLPPGLREKVTASAGGQLDRIDWRIVEKVALERSGIPTRITVPAMAPPLAAEPSPLGAPPPLSAQ